MKILLVGCGKIGAALLTRWQEQKLADEILVVKPTGEPDGSTPYVREPADIPATFTPDLVVFAVKPQIMSAVVPEYKRFADKAVYLSLAAGKTLASIEEGLGGGQARVVRSMPNTPAAIGKGITVACPNPFVTPAEKDITEKALSAVGEVLWVENEILMNPVTALSGSGPAYVFLLIEAMAAAGVKAGLDEEMAQKLARSTVIGSAALAAARSETPAATLRENVTSPNGTTHAALQVLMQEGAGIQPLMDSAIAAASKRAEELSKDSADLKKSNQSHKPGG